MGLNADNWPATVSIFTGVLAKEAVVGTVNSTYSALATSDAEGAGEDEAPYSLIGDLQGALATILANLRDAMGTWGDPLDLDVGDLTDAEAAAEAAEVSTGTFGAMAARFDGAAGAFAYLLFILLYFPCVAAIAAVHRETTIGWTLSIAAWTTGLGYGVATLFYQAAIFQRDPLSSATWIGIMVALFAAVLLTPRRWAEQDPGAAAMARQGA
jgi:ferrous iron transport protein B